MGFLVALALLAAACGDGAAPTAPTTVASGSSVTTATTVPATTAPPATTLDAAPAYPTPASDTVDRWVPEVLATFDHDPAAFTQGFVLDGGVIYESTGLYGESTLREVDRKTGEVLQSVALDDAYFAEGLELVGDRLIQLTWLEETAFVYDVTTFDELARRSYDGQGWGLCLMGDRLVLSDGTPRLRFYDPDSFQLLGDVTVTLDGRPVVDINELECVDDLVFANVWRTTDIVVIDPDTGDVTAVVDASTIDEIDDPDDRAVLNGIAYDDENGVFLLTGKLWPTMYEVRFVAE